MRPTLSSRMIERGPCDQDRCHARGHLGESLQHQLSTEARGRTHCGAGESCARSCGYPAHYFRSRQVRWLAANFPDPSVWITPLSERTLHLRLHYRPRVRSQVVIKREYVYVDDIEQCSPDIMLMLRGRTIADPDRPRCKIASL